MTVVLDASAALEIALEGNRGTEFKDLLSECSIVTAPDIFVSEVTNSFWKYRVFSNITDDQCFQGIEFCLDLVDDFCSTQSLWREVIKESIRLKHPVYDMFYLILARRTGARLLSCDKQLLKLSEKLDIDTE
jgi:predicted nucleic acid-binding protein